MADKHNGKQSEATRLELFIALQYLLEKCPNKKQVSKTLDLQQYAEDNFGVLFDRRRVNPTFDTLVKLTRDNPNVLPYKVIRLDGKPRYYIEKTLFDKKEIKAISKAINNDSSLSKAKAKQYVEAFLDKVCTKEEKEKILQGFAKKNQLEKHISAPTMNAVDYIEELRDSQKRFYFKLKRLVKTVDCSSTDAFNKVNRTVTIENEYMPAIVFDYYQLGTTTDVCLYLQDEKAAVIVNINAIAIKQDYEPLKQINAVTFDINSKTYASLDDWVAKYYTGKTGSVVDIKFQFPLDSKNKLLDKYSRAYREFFKQVMEYEIKEEPEIVINVDGQEHRYINRYAIATISCNLFAFKKWYFEYGCYEDIDILEPRDLNNRLLERYIRTFYMRIEKFGVSREERRRIRQEIEKKEEEKAKKVDQNNQ